MSAKKVDRSMYEPSWAEVILGAVLSVVLGVVLGIVLMALKPLAAVKEMPKEPVAGLIYYIQGSHDRAKASQAASKRKAFAGGASVAVTEDEINSFLPPPPPLWTPKKATDKPKAAPEKKAPEKAKAPEKTTGAVASVDLMTLGGANFHIVNDATVHAVQIAVPVTFNLLGFSQEVTVLGTGKFVKKDAGFAFDPDTLYLGSCPMQRVPFAAGFVAKKFINAQPVPDDVAAAWAKLTDVSVDGNSLKLTMQ